MAANRKACRQRHALLCSCCHPIPLACAALTAMRPELPSSPIPPCPLRSWLHVIHHKYNKGDQMSPFAGLAFHPRDGIWTTNIHDNIHAKVRGPGGRGC